MLVLFVVANGLLLVLILLFLKVAWVLSLVKILLLLVLNLFLLYLLFLILFLIDHPVNVSFFGAAWPPGHLSSSHPFVSSLHRYFPSSPIEAAPWATDAGYLSLFCHVPSLVFGPGVSRVAHSSSEFISLSSIRLYSRSLASFILDWVGFAPDFVPVDPSDL
mmetsp:Transcript_11277/g.16663  ORF Transcript_11277/g.16663 Transcript_11277/m.16663 type:complete len:162 (+) Transcript_11277:940-1425(+)